jgi:hypothetical protein
VIDAAVIISFFERQRTGTGLAELLRDVARLGATELGTHAFFELRDSSGPVLMTSWPGSTEVGLVGPVGVHPLPAIHPLLPRYQAASGARWGFSLSAFTGCFVVLSPEAAPPLEPTRLLGETCAALVAAWDADRRSKDLAERHRLMSQATSSTTGTSPPTP